MMKLRILLSRFSLAVLAALSLPAYPNDYSVSVAKTGQGTVTSTPAGLDCGGICEASFAAGANVTFIATPLNGYAFKGWLTGCPNISGPCTITIKADTEVVASFKQSSYTLSVTKVGSGTVTSTPVGINCGTNCNTNYATSAVPVTLTANPTAGFVFSKWTGACTGTTPICKMTMDASKAVTATFVATPTLTVTKTGLGTIMSNPVGINCGSDCSETYVETNTVVTLIAIPISGYRFSTWEGECTNAVMTCVVTMNTTKSVRATFIVNPATPSLTVTRTGPGMVFSSPDGINCGTDCAKGYPVNTPITLLAIPSIGSTFKNWGGDCRGTDVTCSVSMSAMKSVTATFQ